MDGPAHLIDQYEMLFLFVDRDSNWSVFPETDSLIVRQFIIVGPLNEEGSRSSVLLFIKRSQHLLIDDKEIVRVYKLTEGIDLVATDQP